ncbi:MAG: hypothetical protein KDB82_03765 [Planctomycetes bacterium]|nr:hypothetical protein [Planctomycetota bacterium]
MRYLILIAATLAAGALGAQTYTVTQITNDFAAKNIVSYGTGVTGSFTAPGSSTPDTDDGVVGPVNLNFNFDFFGQSYNQCYISTNGLVSFDPLTSSYPTPAASVPDAAGPNNCIAAAWKDLGRQPLSQNSSAVQYYTDIGTQLGAWEFRVQWTDWPDHGQTAQSAMNTVVVCMYQATGDIEIHFGPLSATYNFCCGIENANGTVGYAGPGGWVVTAGPNMAYRFSPASGQALQITSPATLPAGTEGQAYSYTFQATGGTAPYYWYDASITTTGQLLPAAGAWTRTGTSRPPRRTSSRAPTPLTSP